jgi:hypothetical protein
MIRTGLHGHWMRCAFTLAGSDVEARWSCTSLSVSSGSSVTCRAFLFILVSLHLRSSPLQPLLWLRFRCTLPVSWSGCWRQHRGDRLLPILGMLCPATSGGISGSHMHTWRLCEEIHRGQVGGHYGGAGWVGWTPGVTSWGQIDCDSRDCRQNISV